MIILRSEIKDKFLYWFPVLITSYGVLVHGLGLLDFIQQQVGFPSHLIMFFVDIVVLIGLLMRKNWGYYFAVILYIQQTICQFYWSIKFSNTKYGFGVIQFIVPLICFCIFFILLKAKKLFFTKT